MKTLKHFIKISRVASLIAIAVFGCSLLSAQNLETTDSMKTVFSEIKDAIEGVEVIKVEKNRDHKIVVHNGNVVVSGGKILVADGAKDNCPFDTRQLLISVRDPRKEKAKINNHSKIILELNFDIIIHEGKTDFELKDEEAFVTICTPKDLYFCEEDYDLDSIKGQDKKNLVKLKPIKRIPYNADCIFHLEASEIVDGNYIVKIWMSDCLISEYSFKVDI